MSSSSAFAVSALISATSASSPTATSGLNTVTATDASNRSPLALVYFAVTVTAPAVLRHGHRRNEARLAHRNRVFVRTRIRNLAEVGNGTAVFRDLRHQLVRAVEFLRRFAQRERKRTDVQIYGNVVAHRYGDFLFHGITEVSRPHEYGGLTRFHARYRAVFHGGHGGIFALVGKGNVYNAALIFRLRGKLGSRTQFKGNARIYPHDLRAPRPKALP